MTTETLSVEAADYSANDLSFLQRLMTEARDQADRKGQRMVLVGRPLSYSGLWDFVEDPSKSCRRIIRLQLLRLNGQARIVETWDHSEAVSIPVATAIEVTIPEADNCVRRYSMSLRYEIAEEFSQYYLVSKTCPEALMRSVADTIEASSEDDCSFGATLSGPVGCAACARPLKDEVSKIIGIGPDCAKGLGLAHNQEVATRVLKRRAELYGNPDWEASA